MSHIVLELEEGDVNKLDSTDRFEDYNSDPGRGRVAGRRGWSARRERCCRRSSCRRLGQGRSRSLDGRVYGGHRWYSAGGIRLAEPGGATHHPVAPSTSDFESDSVEFLGLPKTGGHLTEATREEATSPLLLFFVFFLQAF